MNDTLCVRVEKRWKRLWFAASGWLPMLRRTHRARMASLASITAASVRYNNQRRDSEIADAKKVLDKIVSKAARIQWDRGPRPGDYVLSLLLDPRQFGGYAYNQDELKFLAAEIGYRVEREIATCKFIESAREREHRRRMPRSFLDETICDGGFET